MRLCQLSIQNFVLHFINFKMVSENSSENFQKNFWLSKFFDYVLKKIFKRNKNKTRKVEKIRWKKSTFD